MPVHKFIRHGNNSHQIPLKTVEWKPLPIRCPPEKRSPFSWVIFTQEKLTIQSKGAKSLCLGLGVEMSRGMVLVSLKQDLRLQHCSVQNEILFESVKDIVITVQNNSSKEVVLSPGQELCFVQYLNVH